MTGLTMLESAVSVPSTVAGNAADALSSGWMLALILFAVSLLAHEPWRWIGMLVGRNIDIDSELFQWVRAVSTALVAALVMRLVVFPAGALGDVSIVLRAVAMAAGVAAFIYSGGRMVYGVPLGALVLIAGQLLFG
ncbi:MAG: AzlD domain-containing protein [Hyphomicrobiaceae bacterium]